MTALSPASGSTRRSMVEPSALAMGLSTVPSSGVCPSTMALYSRLILRPAICSDKIQALSICLARISSPVVSLSSRLMTR